MGQFDGVGFKETEFEPPERARIRQMLIVLDRDYLPLDVSTHKTMIEAANVVRAMKVIAASVGVMSAIGAAIAFWFKIGGGA